MSEVISCVQCANEGKSEPAQRHVFHLTHFHTTGGGPAGRYALDLCDRHSAAFWGWFRPYLDPSVQREVRADDHEPWLPAVGTWYGPCKRGRIWEYARPVSIQQGMMRDKGASEPHPVLWVYFQSNYAYEGEIERNLSTTFIRRFGVESVEESIIKTRYDRERR
jgi:hypothetical protein